MKLKALKSVLTGISLLTPSILFAHSAMFDDYFVFDNSNEGPTAKDNRDISKKAPTNECTDGMAAGYLCQNIDLMSFLPKEELGGGAYNLNDIWGWTNPENGKEIAIIGRTNGTAFVDVTDAENPIHIGFLPSENGGQDVWRDIKVYSDHAFIVADGRNNKTHGLQVLDLTILDDTDPGSTLKATTTLAGFGNAHNIAINEDSGYAYIVGSDQCSGGLYMVNVTDPSAPIFEGCFSSDGYTHDTQCVIYNGPDSEYEGREICMGYNEDTLTVVDVTDKKNPVQIARVPYEGSAYTHQGWFLNDEHSTLILNDELDEMRTQNNTISYIWDVSDLDDPKEIGRYEGETKAIDHNLYSKDNYVFETNYRAGLRILSSDAIKDGQLEEVAFFDTIPGSNAAQFSGTWSSYIYFESGNIVLSDIGAGLFVVKPNWDNIETP